MEIGLIKLFNDNLRGRTNMPEFAKEMKALSAQDKVWYARQFKREGYIRPEDIVIFRDETLNEVRVN